VASSRPCKHSNPSVRQSRQQWVLGSTFVQQYWEPLLDPKHLCCGPDPAIGQLVSSYPSLFISDAGFNKINLLLLQLSRLRLDVSSVYEIAWLRNLQRSSTVACEPKPVRPWEQACLRRLQWYQIVASTDQVLRDFNMDNQDLKPKNKSQEQSPAHETSEAGTAVSERYVSSHPFPLNP